MHRPVIIDTDPGVDDFIALMLAKQSDRLEIRGVTTVAGNLPLEIFTQNALNIIDFLDLHVPVAKGASKPLKRQQESAEAFHGKGGLGGVVLPISQNRYVLQPAWDFIDEQARQAEGRLELIALGPLTNVATALLKYPDLKKRLKCITFMGGSTGGGNRTPYAEFNIWADPEAAQIVWESGIPLRMVGLDITLKGVLKAQDIQDVLRLEHPYTLVLRYLLEFLQQVNARVGQDFVPLHDALAVASVIDAQLLDYTLGCGIVETESEVYRGRTIVRKPLLENRQQPNVWVGLDVDREQFIHLLKGILQTGQTPNL
ncbi:MAG: nucleoside hydrolase [Niameybacter sp.]